MSWSFVASIADWTDSALSAFTLGTGSAGGASSLNVQAGDLLVAICKWENGGAATPSMARATSTPANNYTFDAGDTVIYAAADAQLSIGYVLAAAADATHTPKLTLSASRQYFRVVVLQFRPDAGETVSKDGTSAIASGSSTAPASGNTTTTGTDGIAIGSYGEYTGATLSSALINGAAATSLILSGNGSAAWYKAYTSGFTGGAAVTMSSSGDWACGIISFKSVAGGGGGGGSLPTRKSLLGVGL